MKANLPAVSRQRSVNSLVVVLGSNPSQEKWTKALELVLNRHWPTILKMRLEKRDRAIMEFCSIIEEARARAANRRFAPTLTVHKTAVAALLELCIDLCGGIPGAGHSFHRMEVLALFRVAINEQSAMQPNPDREETIILETALTLLENAEARNRPPEPEFFSTLAFDLLGESTFRVRCAPENVTVN